MADKRILISAVLAFSMIMSACGKDKNKNQTSSAADESLSSDITLSDSETVTGSASSEYSEIVTTEYSEPLEIPEIIIKTSIHSGNTDIDIPEFKCEKSISAIDQINNTIGNFNTAYDILKKNMSDNQGVICKTFSFTSSKYVTAVIRWQQIPDDKSDGDIFSYVYDIENQKYYQLARVLYDNGISEENILEIFRNWYGSDNPVSIVSSKVQAFRITSSDTVEYYVKAELSDGTSHLYIINNNSVTAYSDENMQAQEVFEQSNALINSDIKIDPSAVHSINGKDYSETELVATASQKYVQAFNLVSYLFSGHGTYSSEYTEKNGKKYYKSVQSGLETYDDAMQALNNIFLAPKNYFQSEIENYLYRDENGDLWIYIDNNTMNYTSSGISGIDSVMDSLVIFTVDSEMNDGSVKSDYFTLIASGDSFKCTYFPYSSGSDTAEESE